MSELKTTTILEVDATQALTIIEEYKRQIADLQNKLSSLSEGTEEYNQVASQLAKTQSNLNVVTQASSKSIDSATQSYNQLEKTLADLKTQWKATNDQTQRDNLGEKIKNINNTLKTLDSSVGDFSRNIGDYSGEFANAFGLAGDGISQLNPKLGSVLKTIQKIIPSIKAIGVASKAAGAAAKSAIVSTGIGVLVIGLGEVIKLTNTLIQKNKELKKVEEEASKSRIEKWQKAKDSILDYQLQLNQIQKDSNLETLQKNLQDIRAKAENETADYVLGGKDKRTLNQAISDLENWLSLYKDTAKKEVVETKQNNLTLLKERKVYWDNRIKQSEDAISLESEKIKKEEENRAKDISKSSEEYFKSDLQRLQDKYNEELSLLQKLGKDTTLLTRKYLEERSKLITSQREKEAADTLAQQENLLKKEKENILDARELETLLVTSPILEGSESQKSYKERFESYITRKDYIPAQDYLEALKKNISSAIDFAKASTKEGAKEVIDILTSNLKGIEDGTAPIVKAAYETDYRVIKENIENLFKLPSELDVNSLKEYSDKLQILLDQFYGIKDLGGAEKVLELIKTISTKTIDSNQELNQEILSNKQKFLDFEYQIKLEEMELEVGTEYQKNQRLLSLQLEYLENTKKNLEELQSLYTIDSLEYKEYGSQIERVNLQIKKNAFDTKKATTNEILEQVNTYSQAAQGIASILDTIAGVQEDEINRKLKNGEISEDQAKADFENNKKLQRSSVWINTLGGMTAALASPTLNTLGPAGWVLSSIQAASILASGLASLYKINTTEFGGGGESGASASTYVPVTPTLNTLQDLSVTSELDIADKAIQSQKDTKVYILESDIQESNKRVEVRESNTSFD